jgi:hypothetical protein
LEKVDLWTKSIVERRLRYRQPLGWPCWRRDRVLHILAQRFHPIKPGKNEPELLDRTIGLFGLGKEGKDDHWIDLQLDKNPKKEHPLNEWLKKNNKGMTVAATHHLGIFNHWFYFTNEDNMKVYKAILHERDAWEIKSLRKAGIPDRVGIEKMPERDKVDRP